MTSILKRTILFSLLGHLTLFSLFSFSFGKKIDPGCPGIYFWGTFLPASNPGISLGPTGNLMRKILINPRNIKVNKSVSEVVLPEGYFKPAFYLALSPQKATYLPKTDSTNFCPARKEAVLVFYPQLPYQFSLYFQDRQIAHIELAFNIKTQKGKEGIRVKRKISSGNLEADLLSMRYISHYLFIQKTRFTPDIWQSVKIDLAAGNDYY